VQGNKIWVENPMIYDSFSFSLRLDTTQEWSGGKEKSENHIHSGFLSEIHLSIYVFVLILTIFQELKSVLLSCLKEREVAGWGEGEKKGQSLPFFSR
jgi:hypothetical protein